MDWFETGAIARQTKVLVFCLSCKNKQNKLTAISNILTKIGGGKKGFGKKGHKKARVVKPQAKDEFSKQRPQRPSIINKQSKNSRSKLKRHIKKIFCCITIKYF